MSSSAIVDNSRVTLHFAIKLADGQIVDSNFEAEPAVFSVGDGQMLEGFERALIGLSSGDEKQFEILPEQGFGMANPNNMQKFPRSQFKDMELEEGLVISFSDAGNGELPGVISEFNDDKVTVDFNHPLAGQTLLFDVKIISVEAAE
ncbi:FKBP-type peptidyl-prolyl cis-trans isomerase [Aliamphritea ceti]|uniref:FKBP-type peptidyl-prolyl cis-trans isomerase n=1 Tax=Aliamphritea ceti TaxID=1524258 RepID=UPI0021C32F13|nr:FKBP-type peptidyl-prolyl cis-trans isomerase [Aliamphritea ceti]